MTRQVGVARRNKKKFKGQRHPRSSLLLLLETRTTRRLIMKSRHLESTAKALPQPVRACPNREAVRQALPRSDLEMGQNNTKKEEAVGWS